MNWEAFGAFKNNASARVLADHLESEGVPTQIQESELEGGIVTSYTIFVPAELAHRARWVVAQSDFEDQELDYLATGYLDSENK